MQRQLISVLHVSMTFKDLYEKIDETVGESDETPTDTNELDKTPF